MFKLDRLLMIVVIFLLNICNVSYALPKILDMFKVVVPTKINCIESITKTGVYEFQPDPTSSLTRCMISMEVPEGSLAFVRPSQRTCETTSSANISAMCSRPHREERFAAGEHHFRFDASESVTIEVNISPIIRLGCNEYFKNLHNLINSVVIFENTESDPLCMIQLPPSIEIHYLDFQTPNAKRCCPDIFVVSTDLEENPISYSESLLACDIQSQRFSATSRCEATFVYLRGSFQQDKIMFRVKQRPLEIVDECTPDKASSEPAEWRCKKSKRRNRLRSKTSQSSS